MLRYYALLPSFRQKLTQIYQLVIVLMPYRLSRSRTPRGPHSSSFPLRGGLALQIGYTMPTFASEGSIVIQSTMATACPGRFDRKRLHLAHMVSGRNTDKI